MRLGARSGEFFLIWTVNLNGQCHNSKSYAVSLRHQFSSYTCKRLYLGCFKRIYDYMMNWPYFCIETSSKSTITTSLKKCSTLLYPVSLLIGGWDWWSIQTVNEQYRDHLVGQLTIKSVTSAYEFGTLLKTPYSTLYYSNHSHTHNSNHLEPLEKIESPQLASLALGANNQFY